MRKGKSKVVISLIVSVVFLIVNGKVVNAQNAGNDLKITYIANEGFLLTTPAKKVLIDALFNDGYGLFSTPPEKTIKSIMNDVPPFDNINLLFLTHYHKDHCDPALINEYIAKHKDVRFVTNKPSIVFIHGNIINFILLKKQFVEMTPDSNHSVSKIIDDVPVKAFGLNHLSFYVKGINIEENMCNTAFLFDLDGIKIFHSGDIKKDALESYLRGNKKWTDSIDVAFLYYELFNDGTLDLEFILKTLSPKYIVLMHVPPRKMEEWKKKTEEMKTKFKNILLFENSMDSEEIHFAGMEK